MAKQAKEGWANPALSKKFHYFRDHHISLCGKWFFGGTLQGTPDDKPSRDDCKACRRKLEASRA